MLGKIYRAIKITISNYTLLVIFIVKKLHVAINEPKGRVTLPENIHETMLYLG